MLELKPPEGSDWHALAPLIPTLLSYALSFVFLGIYWNNHHQLILAVEHANGRVLWANLHLLFWLSLLPLATAWMGRNFAPLPVAMYGATLLLSGISFYQAVEKRDWLGVNISFSREFGILRRACPIFSTHPRKEPCPRPFAR